MRLPISILKILDRCNGPKYVVMELITMVRCCFGNWPHLCKFSNFFCPRTLIRKTGKFLTWTLSQRSWFRFWSSIRGAVNDRKRSNVNCSTGHQGRQKGAATQQDPMADPLSSENYSWQLNRMRQLQLTSENFSIVSLYFHFNAGWIRRFLLSVSMSHNWDEEDSFPWKNMNNMWESL